MRLFADRVIITRTEGLSCEVAEALVPLVSMRFDYGGPPPGGSRDVRAEHDARCVIERLGAIELACVEEIAAPEGCDAEYVVRADGDEHSFCSFTSRAMEAWRALGWRVEVDASYPFRVVERAPDWYARVESSNDRHDWFSLELGVDLDGRRVDLLPVLLDLLERLDAEGGLEDLVSTCRPTWALRVSETHHLTLPVERLRTLLRVVAELHQGERGRAGAFPEVRAAGLVELDTAFQRAGARHCGSSAPLLPAQAVDLCAVSPADL